MVFDSMNSLISGLSKVNLILIQLLNLCFLQIFYFRKLTDESLLSAILVYFNPILYYLFWVYNFTDSVLWGVSLIGWIITHVNYEEVWIHLVSSDFMKSLSTKYCNSLSKAYPFPYWLKFIINIVCE